MTATLRQIDFAVAGIPCRALRSGESKHATVFVHGGIAARTPYCSGAHIWGDVLHRFAADRDVVALDLPGAAGTGLGDGPFTLQTLTGHVRAAFEVLGIARAHLIGHDLGGLVALDFAHDAPDRVAAVTTVASVAAAPSGDTVENLTFGHPPQPPYSRTSQAWALERVAYAHHWIDDTLLDACMAAAAGPGHRAACARMEHDRDQFDASLTHAKTRLYERCRGDGMAVPVQVITGSHDPLGTLDQALWLFKLIAARQRVTQFHVINRAGALPFRDEPEAFHQIVAAFADGLAA